MTAHISRRNMLKIAGAAAGATMAGTALAAAPAMAADGAFAHPGMLHTRADLHRMATQVKAGAEPYTAGFARLTANRRPEHLDGQPFLWTERE
ncbi:twin-arginine translocation signal domain-containing protein [Streptomyces mirabilis]|uniref:twin-arginine translocation signal domain-containing protein n=1 Tax=Streptomyces mirabilis TaxID=68239 RepID=UPI0033BEE9E9